MKPIPFMHSSSPPACEDLVIYVSSSEHISANSYGSSEIHTITNTEADSTIIVGN